MDAGYQTSCLTVEGELASLGENGGSISSVRYLGPGEMGHSGHSGHAMNGAQGSSPVPMSSAAAAGETWQPMVNVDLYGNDYRAISYEGPGSDWRTCKATCEEDRACQAWTWVKPGRTEYGECFLKAPVPEASESDCCVSGLKGGASAGDAIGEAAIDRVMRRTN